MSPVRRRWQALGVAQRVRVVFVSGGLLLAVSLGLVIWGLSAGYLLQMREVSATRQAQATAAAIDRLLAPDNPGLQQQAQELAGVNESAVLVVRDGQVLASTGLQPQQVPQRLRERVQAGEQVRQRVRIDGEVHLLVGIPLRSGAGYYHALPFRELDGALRTLRTALIAAGVVAVLLSVLVARLAVRGALRPVQELTGAAQAVARGELSARMPEDDRDLVELARAFNATTADLERREKAGARFAGTVSHELRTPLTTMANAVALLQRRRGQLPEVAQEAVQLLDSQLARFQRLLLDLLDIAVTTDRADRLTLEPVELVGWVGELATTEGWGPVQAHDAPLIVAVDPRRLERVVSNLVRNAQTHGRGLVRLAVLRRGGNAHIEVDDAGPGVPLEQHEQIFERFTRGAADDTGLRPPGVGLGLAFVAELTALQRGTVRVQDRPGGGARFVVELPLAEP